jgi:catechol 2,3-dioxygenase-like lactoylglutathione lyase family enzyme
MPTISKTTFIIAVPDLKSSAAFYRDVLGFTVHPISDAGLASLHGGRLQDHGWECPDAIPARKLGDQSYFAYLQIDEIESY